MKKYLFLTALALLGVFQAFSKTEITNANQVAGTLNLKVDWGETDVNLSDPGTSLNKYKLVYRLLGGTSSTVDNISSDARTYTIVGLAVGTYEIELIEVIRVSVESTPFSDPYVDTETTSGTRTVVLESLNVAPVAKCSDRTLFVGNGTTVNLWGHQAGEGSTDANNDELTFQLYPEGPYSVGTHMIELTVSDPEGLFSKCSFTLTVVDNTPPVVLAKNAVIVVKENGFAELNIEDVDQGSFDNVSWVEKTLSKSLFTCEEVGFNSVTLTVKDESGNTSSKQVTVQVVENIEPYIIDEPIKLVADENGQAILTDSKLETLVYDNCGLNSIVASKRIFNSSVPSDYVTIIATDKSGNVSAKELNVTVESSNIVTPMGLVSEKGVVETKMPSVLDIKEKQKKEDFFSKRNIDSNDSKVLHHESPLFTYGPNPLEDRIKVGLQRDGLDLFTLKVIDLTGNTLQEKKFLTKEVFLDLNKLNRGTYFLQVSSPNESLTKRIELKR